jgi:outer membrane receptor protein involved in Fe transport
VFFAQYKDQFGRVGNQLKNVGASESKGFDLTLRHRFGIPLEATLSYAYLEAQFTEGPQQGKTPQYAPKHLGRASLAYWYTDRAHMTLHSQYTDTHFGDDANTDQWKIPNYWLFDLSGEFPIPRTVLTSVNLRAVWMVKNLLDEQGFARVRANGVEPLTPREYTFGIKADF